MITQDKLEVLRNRAFKTLNITPYEWQTASVDSILKAFLVDGKQNVILSADTGSGKSIIGAAVAIAIHIFRSFQSDPISYILMQNNALVEQYGESLDGLQEFIVLKGSSNYACEYLQHNGQDGATAEECARPALKMMHKRISSEPFVAPPACMSCEFKELTARAAKTPHVITNYHKFLTRVLLAGQPTRLLNIFDEAHTLNDVCVDFLSVNVNEKTFKSLLGSIEAILQVVDKDISVGFVEQVAISSNVIKKAEDYFINNGITELRFDGLLAELTDASANIVTWGMKESTVVVKGYEDKFIKLIKRFNRVAQTFAAYFQHKKRIEYVFDRNDGERDYFAKPIFIGDLSKEFLGEFNLFMSATISPDMMIETLRLDQNRTTAVILPSVYDRTNKPIVCGAKIAINFNSLANPRTIEMLAEDLAVILNRHLDNGEKGIVLAPSFKMAKDVYFKLPHALRNCIILHENGQKAPDLIDRLKKSRRPTVLISPAIFEGIDLKGDSSTFQVFLKAPYPSLSDKRMSVIAHRYSRIYKTITLMKIIQGIGRSVRGPTERAITYVMDTNIEALLRSDVNQWKHTHILVNSIDELPDVFYNKITNSNAEPQLHAPISIDDIPF